MKRLLSIILALCMIMTLIPSVFAEDTTTETETGITVVYGMKTGPGYDFVRTSGDTVGTDMTKVTFKDTNGFWQYHSIYSTKTRTPNFHGTYGLYFSLSASDGEWAAIEINVPVAGKYDVDIKHGIASSAGSDKVGMWIFPLINSSTGVAYTDEELNALLIEENALTTAIDCYDSTQSSNVTAKTITAKEDYEFPSAGTYIVVYKSLDSDGNAMYVGDITLKNGEGSVLMGVDTAVGASELEVDSETTGTTNMTATAYMSNGDVADCDITYTSGDENVATVDANGLITAKAYGVNPVEITASATIDGYTVENSEEITVNADGIEIAYNVGTGACDNSSTGFLTALTYDYTNGFYEFVGTTHNSADPAVGGVATLKAREYNNGKGIQLGGEVVAFEVYIPRRGSYTMKMWNNEYIGGKITKVYATPSKDFNINALGDTPVGEYNCLNSTLGNNKFPVRGEANPNVITGFNFAEPGYYVISFLPTGSYGFIGDFTLISGTGLDPVAMPAMIKMGADELAVGGTTTAEGIKYLSNGASAGATASAIASSNENVVTVADGTVTAVGAGTATLTATVTYNGETENLTREIKVVDIEADDTITVAVDDDGDGVASVDSTKAVGDEYTVTAVDRSSENLEFRGWVRGSADNGTWVSNENPYTFTVTTNTYLTAVYSAAATVDKPVTEYYNWNRAYLGTVAKEPTLTGYSFKDWIITRVSDILSRAVAQYTVETTEYSVTTDNSFVISVKGGTYVYDAEVTCTANNDVYWYRDGKCVDYGKTYTFNVWGDTKITTSSDGSTGAKVMLDKVVKTTDTNEKSYMIEYDTGDKELVEVGILFGNGFVPTVEECSEKMTSQRNSAHGQFTAASTYSNARGYLIYNDNGTYRVIYAD